MFFLTRETDKATEPGGRYLGHLSSSGSLLTPVRGSGGLGPSPAPAMTPRGLGRVPGLSERQEAGKHLVCCFPGRSEGQARGGQGGALSSTRKSAHIPILYIEQEMKARKCHAAVSKGSSVGRK